MPSSLYLPKLLRISNILSKLEKTYASLTIITSRIMSSSTRHDDGHFSTSADGLLKILENNPKRLKRIKFLGHLFSTNGFELRIAGGAVRDILTGKEPSDIDLATTARPEQSLELLQRHENLMRIIVTDAGVRHGTVAVKFKEVELDFKRIKLDHKVEQQAAGDSEKPEYDEESPFEITTLRCDTTTDGRHAEVKFISDWKMDAERRDLTINAMFLTLDRGQLVDFFEGESDLKNNVVRFVGDADRRIKEDYLRILRYFRFWSRYGENKPPDKHTLETIKTNLDGLDQISGERIWLEIKKTFIRPSIPVMNLMLRSEVIKKSGVVDPQLEDYNAYIDNVLEELKTIEENIAKSEDKFAPVLRFATTIRTLDMYENALKRLKFSNIEKDIILFIYDNRTRTSTLKDLKHILVMTAPEDRKRVLHNQLKSLSIYKGIFDEYSQLISWEVPVFPLTGGRISEEFRKRKLPKKLNSQIRVVQKTLKSEWVSKDYKLSLDDLLGKLQIEIDNIMNDSDNVVNRDK